MNAHSPLQALFLSFALFIALLAAGCRSGRLGGDESVRVGTYNIRTSLGDRATPNAWDLRKADVVEEIRRLDIDILGLQEVSPDQAAYLVRAFTNDFTLVGDHRAADRRSDEASPILYRTRRFTPLRGGTFWLSETPDVPASVSWESAYPRLCTWLVLKDRETGKTFAFANTHTDHKSAEARARGLRLILERLRQGECARGLPLVLTGDHNCRETEAPALAVAKEMSNALYASAALPEGPWRTYNGWRYRAAEPTILDALTLTPGERNVGARQPFNLQCGGERIDYIYVSRNVRVLSYATYGETRGASRLYPSDHFPSAATLQF